MAPRVASTPSVRRRRWPWVFVLLLLVVPTLEIAVIIAVGRAIGPWPTLALLILESALGAWLVKREGARTWAALATALNSGRMPSRQLADAALVLVGGTLLLTPGFLTDLVGFFFILPFTRPLARALLETVVTRRLLSATIVTTAFPRPSDSGAAPGSGPGRPDGYAGPPRRSAAADDVIEGEIVD